MARMPLRTLQKYLVRGCAFNVVAESASYVRFVHMKA